MIAARPILRSVVSILLVLFARSPQEALALPTMIRLGYTGCTACHISPQGGGPLNLYGRGIDRAQSLRGGEYIPATDDLTRALTLGGRTTQDFRLVVQEQASRAAGGAVQTRFWPRAMYRHVTDIGNGFRASAIITAAAEGGLRPALSYDPRSTSSPLFVNTALLHYRAGQTVELAAGRDQLPSGINVPDLGLWTKSRNRNGYYDAPTQLQMVWTGSHVRASPFIYGPGGNEAAGERESGAGTIVELVSDRRRTVVGVSLLSGTAENGLRRTVGGYLRLGFGRWGILAEHDVTERTRVAPAALSFTQDASYGQVFCAIREWLVTSASGERLHVTAPFDEKLLAGKLDLAARLASQASVVASVRLQRDQISGRTSVSAMLQAEFKTVQ